MALGNGIGLPYNRRFGLGVGGLKPCLDFLDFWSGKNLYSSNTVKNLIGDDINITNSNVMYFDGTLASVATIQDNFIAIADKWTIYNSLDNSTYVKWVSGDPPILGLFQVFDNILKIGTDGANFFTGWYSLVVGENTATGRKIAFTLAENNVENNTNLYDETNIVGFVFPLGQMSPNTILDPNMVISPY